jgi:imidazolonepropionase-like amidohydrolase
VFVIQNGTIIDGTGTKPFRGNVRVEGEKIAAVAKEVSLDGATIVDASGQFVLPGLIDCHVHLCLDGDASGQVKTDDGYIALQMLKHAQDSLRAGFTTLRDCGGMNYLEMSLRNAITDGLFVGPRLALAGRLLSITSSGASFYPGMYREADGVDEVRKGAREQFKRGADFIKVMSSGAVLAPGEQPRAPQFEVDELRAAVQEATKVGSYVAAHAHSVAGMRNAVEAGARTIEHGTFLSEDAALMDMMAERGVFVVPTLKVFRDMTSDNSNAIPTWMVEKAKRIGEHHRHSIQTAIKNGINVALGTDACTPFNRHGDNADEFALLGDCGMSALQAIHAGTLSAARALGWDSWLGSVEVGKAADIIAVAKDPLADLRNLHKQNVVWVMKAGRFVHRNTKDATL